MNIEDIHSQHEKQHWVDLIAIGVVLERIFHKYIDLIFMRSSILKAGLDGKLNLDFNPVFLKIMNEALKEFCIDVETTTVRAVRKEWNLSVQKNDKFMARLLAGIKIPEKIRKKLFATNMQAVNSFINRKTQGFKLSERIWDLTKQFRQKLEAGLQLGVAQGTPAATMATQMKVSLKDPDRLYRRVRDELGQLQLSRAAKQYHPGSGQYRSSYRNALRLTRNEMNLAYRTADYERWKDMDFIGGFEVHLSNRHQIPDICDQAVGRYPKNFKFVGWHCQCLCMPFR
jgi:hypothetical protein